MANGAVRHVPLLVHVRVRGLLEMACGAHGEVDAAEAFLGWVVTGVAIERSVQDVLRMAR